MKKTVPENIWARHSTVLLQLCVIVPSSRVVQWVCLLAACLLMHRRTHYLHWLIIKSKNSSLTLVLEDRLPLKCYTSKECERFTLFKSQQIKPLACIYHLRHAWDGKNIFFNKPKFPDKVWPFVSEKLFFYPFALKVKQPDNITTKHLEAALIYSTCRPRGKVIASRGMLGYEPEHLLRLVFCSSVPVHKGESSTAESLSIFVTRKQSGWRRSAKKKDKQTPKC